MSKIINLSKKRKEKNDNFEFRPFLESDSFNYELLSLPISALLFIHEYTFPNLPNVSYQNKIKSQLKNSCFVNYHLYKKEIEICEENLWETNQISHTRQVFKINGIPNIDYFNFMLYKSEFTSGAFDILDEAVYYYIQTFNNQINNFQNLNIFPSLRESKKSAMSSNNSNLIKIINQIESGDRLKIMESKSTILKYCVNL